MIIRGIVRVTGLPDEPYEKVAVDAFVVMQWNEIKTVQPQHCRDQQDRDHGNKPDTLRHVLKDRRRRWNGALSFSRRSLLRGCLLSVLSSGFCRGCIRQLVLPS